MHEPRGRLRPTDGGPGSRPGRAVVLHTVHSLQADGGGPSRTVPALCEAVARGGGADVLLLTCVWRGRPNLLPDPRLVESFEIPDEGPWRGNLRRRFAAEIRRLCVERGVNVLHDHGQWLPTNMAAAAVGRRLRLPRINSPRGMLLPGASTYRRSLKRLAWHAYARRDLAAAAAVHATADLERDELRRIGVRAPVVVVPNGLTLPASVPEVPKQNDPREALFLSRVHPKKGLPDLVDAWASVRPAGWRLVVAGPDEDGHGAEIARRAAAAGIADAVRFVGAVDGPAKWELYRRASLFVLPSRSENFGVVVAEALAMGTPVLTTTATPWRLLTEGRCGWWVPPDRDSIEAALRDAVASPDDELAAMGERGRVIATARFDWDRIAETFGRVYSDLARGRPPEDS